MTIVFALVGIAVVIGIALAAVGRLGELPEAGTDRAPLNLPEGTLGSSEVDDVRFGVGMRGYRMDEVDEVLDRVSEDLAERDERIAALEARLAALGGDVQTAAEEDPGAAPHA